MSLNQKALEAALAMNDKLFAQQQEIERLNAELARLQAIEVAAEGTFKALNGTLSVLRMWREFAPRNWDETDIEAVDMANKALAAYEQAVKS